jgi:glycosyltransferase involved in cell wall biosynthesis
VTRGLFGDLGAQGFGGHFRKQEMVFAATPAPLDRYAVANRDWSRGATSPSGPFARASAIRHAKLSVAMCTYNGGPYLREQLDSIAAQRRLPDELVVCDDGSTDRTVAILEDFAATAPFPVRVYVNPANLGTAKNFERAIGLATGEVIALADQDDVWYPHKLERLEKELARSSRIGLVFSDADVVDDRLRPVGYRLWEALRAIERNRRLIERGRPFEVTGCTAAFRADHKELVIPIPTEWLHDAWTAFLIAAVADIARIDEPLLAYRQHAANQCGLARYRREKHGTVQRNRKPTAEKLRQIECKVALLRAAYHRLDRNRDRFPTQQGHLRLLRGAIRHAEMRAAILRETSLTRRVLTASWELATLRYVRYSEGFRQCRKDVIVRR